MNLPRLTYLTNDGLSEGVGASQVLAYVERLAARGMSITLHSFEKEAPTMELRDRLARLGVAWIPHRFGSYGTLGGLQRLTTGARAVRGADLVHARSDLAAASAMLATVRHWVWDVRSLWVDQRIDLGTLRRGSLQEKVLRQVERQAARRSSAIVTLTEAVVPVLTEKFGADMSRKVTVIPTCVDTGRFKLSPLPKPCPLKLLLAGTINTYYDVPAMVRLVQAAQIRRKTEFVLITPAPSPWESLLSTVNPHASKAAHSQMPERIAACHAGLCICRSDAGVSKLASMPTKIGELLASGRPVILNEGLGDASKLIREHACGVILQDATSSGIEAALDQLEILLADEQTPIRCRALAERHFDLDLAADRLLDVYQKKAA